MNKAQAQTRGEDYERFGKNLASLRENLGLSQYDISKKLGLSQSTYAGYETGTRKIPLSMIIKLSDFFKVKPDTLIGLEDNVKSSTITPTLEAEEEKLLDLYKKLNSKGKKKHFERAEELIDLGYIQKGDISVTA